MHDTNILILIEVNTERSPHTTVFMVHHLNAPTHINPVAESIKPLEVLGRKLINALHIPSFKLLERCIYILVIEILHAPVHSLIHQALSD